MGQMPKIKKQTLTQEERLAQALVPESEQPYVLLGNWVWVRGSTCLKPMTTKKPKGDVFYYIDIDAIDNENQTVKSPKEMPVSKAPSRASREVKEGDTLFSMVRPYLKNIAYIDSGLANCIASTGFFVCRPSDSINGEYLYFLMISGYVVEGLNDFMKGDNSPSIRQENIFNFAFPLPPLAEQQRIVTNIKSLFTKLDHAKEMTKSALDSFEDRKAAILHKAFTGEFTAKWREKNGFGLDSWKEQKLDDVCVSIYDGDHMPPPKSEIGVPFLVISNINQGYVSFQKTRFVPEEYYKNLSETRTPQVSDILYSVTGSFGIPALIETDEPFCFQRHIALLRPDKAKLNSKCFWYILQTQEVFNQADSIATGTAQRTVPIKGLRKISFRFPALPEQEEIVRILDSLLTKEQKARQLAEDTIEKIDLMKKTILARAFRGELGTNDPSEESALGLLRESFGK